MHGHGIAGALWSAAWRLASVVIGIRGTIAAVTVAAIFAGAVRRANADVEYDYTGANFTKFIGDTSLFSTANKVTADFIFSSPLPPGQDSANLFGNGTSSLMSFSISDKKNTILSTSSDVQIISGVFDVNVAGQITGANIDIVQNSILPNTQSEEIGISPTGDSGVFTNSVTGGRGSSLVDGMWSGPVTTSSPGPSLYIEVATGTPNSLSDKSTGTVAKPTGIVAELVLATTPPTPTSPSEIIFPVSGIPSLPSTVTTLGQAASKLGYVGFDWIQTATIPSPSPFYQKGNPTALTGQIVDPPPGDYTYNNPPNDTYPFYYNLADAISSENNMPTGKCAVYSQSGCVIPLGTGTSLNFSDGPADICIAGPNGMPSVGYSNNLATAQSLCGGSKLALPSSFLSFTTEIVGVTAPPVTTKTSPLAPPDCGTCVFLGGFSWDDNFNGTVENTFPDPKTGTGGVFNPVALTSDVPVDPTSGTGGITIVSVNGTSVPEPSTLILLATSLFFCWVMVGKRKIPTHGRW